MPAILHVDHIRPGASALTWRLNRLICRCSVICATTACCIIFSCGCATFLWETALSERALPRVRRLLLAFDEENQINWRVRPEFGPAPPLRQAERTCCLCRRWRWHFSNYTGNAKPHHSSQRRQKKGAPTCPECESRPDQQAAAIYKAGPDATDIGGKRQQSARLASAFPKQSAGPGNQVGTVLAH
jgi:hypothetical protein